MKRFPKAKTPEEAVHYYKNRAIQFLKHGWTWTGIYTSYSWGIETSFKSPEGQLCHSVYVLEPNKGRLSSWFKLYPHRVFVTSSECPEMISWLNSHNKKYQIINLNKSSAYELIETYYGDTKSSRGDQYYMNHIDEGLYILEQLKADQETKDAWCLHPIVQSDAALRDAVTLSFEGISSKAMMYAMEYRWRANNHLSFHAPKVPEYIELLPVRQMLIADKIQNCKDFELYLRGRPNVPNSERLYDYFHKEWFKSLYISEEYYETMAGDICKKSGLQWIR